MVRNLIVLILIFFCVVFLSINSQIITIRLFPSELNTANNIINLPAYIAILVFTAIGLLIGTIFEYSRTWRDRADSRKRLRDVERLKSQVNHLTNESTSETDEILRLLK